MGGLDELRSTRNRDADLALGRETPDGRAREVLRSAREEFARDLLAGPVVFAQHGAVPDARLGDRAIDLAAHALLLIEERRGESRARAEARGGQTRGARADDD